MGGGANYVTTAGDVMYFRSLGSGNWKQVTSPAIGYRPVNKAGDTITGGLTVNGSITSGSAATLSAADNVLSNSAPLQFTGTGASGSVFIHGLNGAGDNIFSFTRVGSSNYSLAWQGDVTTGSRFITTSIGNDALWVSGGNIKVTNGGTSKFIRINPSTGSLEFINSAYTVGISTLSDAGVWTAANFVATSDSNKKTNVRKAEPRDFSELGHYTYNLIEGDVKGRGPMAQEAVGTCDEYVYEGDNGTLGLDKAGMALEWVQNLARRVAALEGK
jgi:hypothetical protein